MRTVQICEKFLLPFLFTNTEIGQNNLLVGELFNAEDYIYFERVQHLVGDRAICQARVGMCMVARGPAGQELEGLYTYTHEMKLYSTLSKCLKL